MNRFSIDSEKVVNNLNIWNKYLIILKFNYYHRPFLEKDMRDPFGFNE